MSGSWTPADLPDLHGVRAVVTGANSGIGLHTALELARHGARVVLTARDRGKGDRALATIREQVPQADAEVRLLDLADLASVRAFAASWDGADDGLDLLVNNAGVMATPRRTTADGFELQLGTNHLGHFALTGLLLPHLLRGAVQGGPARVVTVSSSLHRRGTLDRTDLMLERTYAPYPSYNRSKLANLLFAFELQRRAEAAALALASLAAHPGYAATNLQFVGPEMSGSRFGARVMGVANRLFAQPAEQGAWPTLRAAGDPGARGGDYFGPGRLRESRGSPQRVGTSEAAQDRDDAAWLWARSVELTGVDPAPAPAA